MYLDTSFMYLDAGKWLVAGMPVATGPAGHPVKIQYILKTLTTLSVMCRWFERGGCDFDKPQSNVT